MIRLTGGEMNGRLLKTPSDLKTRPTQARLRQALFNSIQMELPDAKVLDLFAGSGALGFEALSRGAALAVLVDSGKGAKLAMQENIRSLKVEERTVLLNEDIFAGVKKAERQQPFDIVLADPPYAEGWELKLLKELPWEKLLRPDGWFVLEWGRKKSQIEELPDEVGCLKKTRERIYGESFLTHYRRSSGAET